MAKRLKKYQRYVSDITRGKVPHCRKVKQAIARFTNDLKRQDDKDFAFFFDEAEADRAIRFIEENLKLFEGEKAGTTIDLDPWQAFIVANLYGWKFKKTGKRRFKKAFIFVGRGNGKTPLMAAIGFSFLLRDHGAQVYSVATSVKQATLSFKHAKGFVQQSEKLSSLIEAGADYMCTEGMSIMRPVSSKFKSFDGFNPSCVIADEVSAMPNGSILEPFISAQFKREESLMLMITTANFISTNSPGYLEYGYSEGILSGTVENDRYFCMIYEIDKGDDWKTVDLRKANPASFISMKELEDLRSEAVSRSGSFEQSFRTKNLNEWLIGSHNEYIKADRWTQCEENARKFAEYLTEEKLLTYPAAMGADFSKSKDLTVFTVAFWIREIERIYLRHFPYIPRDSIHQKSQNENELFMAWVREGFVRVSLGEYIDKRQVADDILEENDRFKIQSLGYDPAMSLQIIEAIEQHMTIVDYPQHRKTMSPPSKEFEELVNLGKVIDDNPVMKWCVSNARVYESNGEIHVEKETKDSPKKIDLVVSSIIAVDRLREAVKIDSKPAPKPVDYEALKKLIYG